MKNSADKASAPATHPSRRLIPTNHALERFAERVRHIAPEGADALRDDLIGCLSAAEVAPEGPSWLLTDKTEADGYLVAGSMCVPFRDESSVRLLLTVITPDTVNSPVVAMRRKERRAAANTRAARERGPLPRGYNRRALAAARHEIFRQDEREFKLFGGWP